MALDKKLVESFEQMLDINEADVSDTVNVDGRSKSYKSAVGRIKERKNKHMTKSVMKEMDLEKDMEDAVKEMVHAGDDMTTIKGKIGTMMKDKKIVSETNKNPSSDKNLPSAEKETIDTSNKDNRGNTVKADTAAHKQENDSHGDMSDNKDLKAKKSDATGEVEADKNVHDQSKDSHGDATPNNTITAKGTPESDGDVEADTAAHKQATDELDTNKTKVVVKEKAMKEDEIVIKTDGDKSDDKDADKKDAPMTDKQKDVDVDDDGDIGKDDLADLRSGKTDADIGKDDGADQDEKKSDDKSEKKPNPFVKEEDEIDGDSETLKKATGDSETDDEEDKDSLKEEESSNDKVRPEDDKKNDKVVNADNRGTEVEADKEAHVQASDKNAETNTGSGAKATPAEADKPSHVQANDKQDGSTDHNIKGHGAGEKGVEADKAAHDQGKDKISEEELSVDFKERAKVVFETAVNEKVNAAKKEIEKEYADKMDKEKKDMEVKISEFTDYAVKEWLEENKLEVKYSLRTELAEGFINNLKTVFEDHYISIPEEDIDVVDELTESVESFKDQVEESGNTIDSLKTELLSLKKDSIINKLSEGLTDTQKVRLNELSESVEATGSDEFETKLGMVKETYFSNDESNKSLISSLTEEVNTESTDSVSTNGSVDFYANWLSSTTKSNNF